MDQYVQISNDFFMKKRNGIKHIFFDLDHTLWDFEANSDIAFKTIFSIHKLSFDTDKFLNSYRKINQEYWKLYREERISKDRLRYGRLRDTFDLIKFEIDDRTIDQLAIDYIEELPKNNNLFDCDFDFIISCFWAF